MNHAPFTRQRVPNFTHAVFPQAAKVLLEINATALRQTQREIDEQAERYTEAQRGKPARINPHDS